MKKVSGKIKLELAQFRELEAFMQFASDLDAETKEIDSGQRMTQMLNQPQGKPLAFEIEAAVIFAAMNGFLDGFPALKQVRLKFVFRIFSTRSER